MLVGINAVLDNAYNFADLAAGSAMARAMSEGTRKSAIVVPTMTELPT